MKQLMMAFILFFLVVACSTGKEYEIVEIQPLPVSEDILYTFYLQPSFKPYLFNNQVFYVDEQKNLVKRNGISESTTLVLEGGKDRPIIIGVLQGCLYIKKGGMLFTVDENLTVVAVAEIQLTGELYYHPNWGIYIKRNGEKQVLLRDKEELGYTFLGSPVVTKKGDVFVNKRFDIFQTYGTLLRISKEKNQVIHEGVRGFGILDDGTILCSNNKLSIKELASEENYSLVVLNRDGELICDLSAALWEKKKELYLYFFTMGPGNTCVTAGAYLENGKNEERIWPFFTFRLIVK